MGLINLIVMLVVLVLGGIVLIGYFQDKGEMKITQTNILENLSPQRMLTGNERQNIKKLYKLNLPNNTPVYSLTGSVGYIVLETNGAGNKEWLIANVLVANKSAILLNKNNIKLEEMVMNDEENQPKIEALNKRLAANEITEEQAIEEANQIIEKYINHTIEFIIAEPSRKDKPVYLLNYNDGEMAETVNLIAYKH